MLSDFLKKHIKSQASYVDYGYGQVEPNYLSAKRTHEIYAQLPAAADIEILENGQFAKYAYADGEIGEVNFTGEGEWMLVFNEIKLYREFQEDCEFAMLKDNYQARVYSPYGMDKEAGQSRFYNGNGVDAEDGSITFADGTVTVNGLTFPIDDVTAGPDYYEMHYNEDPFHLIPAYKEQKMPAGTTMVPRLFKTHIGDIFTTNTINADELNRGDKLYVGEKGILTTEQADASDTFAGSGDMVWQVVKVYTMPDHQKGVKIQRIA